MSLNASDILPKAESGMVSRLRCIQFASGEVLSITGQRTSLIYEFAFSPKSPEVLYIHFSEEGTSLGKHIFVEVLFIVLNSMRLFDHTKRSYHEELNVGSAYSIASLCDPAHLGDWLSAICYMIMPGIPIFSQFRLHIVSQRPEVLLREEKAWHSWDCEG